MHTLDKADQRGIDASLGLAIVFAERRAAGLPGERRKSPQRMGDFIKSHPEFGEELEIKYREFQRLRTDEQEFWLIHALRRASRSADLTIDDQLHSSHVLEWLRAEPPHLRSFIPQFLPPLLAQTVGQELRLQVGQRREPEPEPPLARSFRTRMSAAVQAAFCRSFTPRSALEKPEPMDFLNGTQLKALIYILAIHEIAIAYNGEPDFVTGQSELHEVLSTSDLCAVVNCRREIGRPSTLRKEFARQQVGTALKPDSGRPDLQMLEWSLLAQLLACRETEAAAYITQKLPVTEARVLLDLIANFRHTNQASAFEIFVEDSRRLAANLKMACSENNLFITHDT